MVRTAVVVSLSVLAFGPSSQQKHPFNERPAEAVAVMSGRYAGTYRLTDIARFCGEVPGELNAAGVTAFVVLFYPDPGPGKGGIDDVTFDSKELIGKVTSSTKFFLSLNLTSPKIGSPPAYVLNTSQPGSSGTATVTTPSPGTIELKVKGTESLYGSVDLTVTCKPRAK